MNNIIIRNIEEKDIESIADITIKGWKSAYKEVNICTILKKML